MTKVWALFRGDVRSVVRCNKILLVMIFGYQAAYVLGALSFLGILTVVLGGMLAYTSIAMDERDGWNRFVLTTGYSRKEYVLSKYLLGVAGTLFCSLTMGMFSLIGMSMGKISAENNIAFLLPVLIGGTLIMLSVELPLSFWFGMEKARLLSILIIALACGLYAGFTEGNDGLPFQGWSFTGLMMIVVSVIILALSVMISLKVFDRREF